MPQRDHGRTVPRRAVVAFTSAIAVATWLAFGSAFTAAAAPQDAGSKLPPAAINNPEVPLSTILALPDVIQQDGNVRIDPKLDPSVPIIRPDGTPVPGQTEEAMVKASRCTIGITAPLGIWSPQVTGSCAMWGSPGFQLGYKFTSNQAAAAKATGWVVGLGEVWYSLGSTNNVLVTVPWGNVVAMPKGKAIALHTGTGVHVDITYPW